jgi:16S rRNA (guanine527-N7)-methyltransferase
LSTDESSVEQKQVLSTKLDEACRALDIVVSHETQMQLIEYLYELSKWNRIYNLTAIRSIDEMLVQHLFDCLAIIPSIEAYEKKHDRCFANVVDVGSGAGLPAVVLAIVKKGMHVTSIDAVEKKHAFVSHAANKLGLVNLNSRHARVESITNFSPDLIVSRAFASLTMFVELASGLAGPSTRIAAMKSKQVEAEIHEFEQQQTDWQVDVVDQLHVPQLDAERFLVWVRRKSHE